MTHMYRGDSFHTLSGMGQVGLILLSGVLSLVLLGLAWRLMRGRYWALRFGIALLLFFGFVWLSPQVYYTYYLTLFDGLPWQVVVKDPPGPQALAALLTFQGPGSLSAHSQGALGWLLLVMAAVRNRCLRQSAMR